MAGIGIGRQAEEKPDLSQQGFCLVSQRALISAWYLFRFPLLMGLLAGVTSASLRAYGNQISGKFLEDNIHPGGNAYGAFATLVVFFVVFRLGQSYGSYWDGINLTHKMLGDWYDASSSIMAIVRASQRPTSEVLAFQHTMIRLISCVNALIFAALEGHQDILQSNASQFEIIDLEGLDDHTQQMIFDSDRKVEMVYAKIQHMMVGHMKTGVLDIPPPILNRCMAELGNALMKYHEAEKLLVPFPRPYVWLQRVLLFAFAVVTPLWICVWTSTIAGSFFFTTLLVFSMYGLTAISEELDKPFDHKTLDFETRSIQKRLNASLECTVAEFDSQLPFLSSRAKINMERSTTLADCVKKHQSSKNLKKPAKSVEAKHEVQVFSVSTPQGMPATHPFSLVTKDPADIPYNAPGLRYPALVEARAIQNQKLAFLNSATLPSGGF